MAKLVKVVTSGFIAWIVNGKVTLAKDKVTGRFIKRATVQAWVDNIAAASVECALSYNGNANMFVSSWAKNTIDRMIQMNSMKICFDCGELIGNSWATVYNHLSTHHSN